MHGSRILNVIATHGSLSVEKSRFIYDTFTYANSSILNNAEDVTMEMENGSGNTPVEDITMESSLENDEQKSATTSFADLVAIANTNNSTTAINNMKPYSTALFPGLIV